MNQKELTKTFMMISNLLPLPLVGEVLRLEGDGVSRTVPRGVWLGGGGDIWQSPSVIVHPREWGKGGGSEAWWRLRVRPASVHRAVRHPRVNLRRQEAQEMEFLLTGTSGAARWRRPAPRSPPGRTPGLAIPPPPHAGPVTCVILSPICRTRWSM